MKDNLINLKYLPSQLMVILNTTIYLFQLYNIYLLSNKKQTWEKFLVNVIFIQI